MGLEAHACSLRVFVTLHVSGAVLYTMQAAVPHIMEIPVLLPALSVLECHV